MDGFGLDASTRWTEAVKDAQYQHVTKPRSPEVQDPGDSKSPASPAYQNWQRVTAVAKRAGAEDRSSSESEGSAQADGHGPEQDEMHKRKKLAKKVLGRKAQSEDEKAAKTMELAYWLELVDQKHRHGSNLRKYHAYWQKQDTAQSFFTWLDNGDGKDVSLEECSRERLNKMQVRYLSRSERMNYLVKINQAGLLMWAKNGELVWTKDELYKDSMEGIVPMNEPTPAFEYNLAPKKVSSGGTTSESDSDEENTTKADEGEQYTNEDFHRAKGPAKLNHVSASVLYNHVSFPPVQVTTRKLLIWSDLHQGPRPCAMH